MSPRERRSQPLGILTPVAVSLLLLSATTGAQEQPPAEVTFDEFDYESELEPGEIEYFDPELVRDSADDVFNSPEFRALPRLNVGDGPQAQQTEPEAPTYSGSSSSGSGGQIGGGFAEFLRDLFGGAATALIALAVLLVVGGILAGVFLVLSQWRGRQANEAPADDASDEDESAPFVALGSRPPDAWLEAARQAAAAGHFEEAISLLLRGAMAHAERAGLIRPRRGLTYRDYLRVVPRSSAWHPALNRLIRIYAPIGFGRRAASATMFQDVVSPYEEALATEPVANSTSEQVLP